MTFFTWFQVVCLWQNTWNQVEKKNWAPIQYRKSHCGDKTVVRSSYLHNGISYTGKKTSILNQGPDFYWWILYICLHYQIILVVPNLMSDFHPLPAVKLVRSLLALTMSRMTMKRFSSARSDSLSSVCQRPWRSRKRNRKCWNLSVRCQQRNGYRWGPCLNPGLLT